MSLALCWATALILVRVKVGHDREGAFYDIPAAFAPGQLSSSRKMRSLNNQVPLFPIKFLGRRGINLEPKKCFLYRELQDMWKFLSH